MSAQQKTLSEILLEKISTEITNLRTRPIFYKPVAWQQVFNQNNILINKIDGETTEESGTIWKNERTKDVVIENIFFDSAITYIADDLGKGWKFAYRVFLEDMDIIPPTEYETPDLNVRIARAQQQFLEFNSPLHLILPPNKSIQYELSLSSDATDANNFAVNSTIGITVSEY